MPVAIVTGTDDKVPGFVTDPADHLFPAQTAPTASYALNVAGADHVLVASPTFARAWPAARLFVEGYGLGDRRRGADARALEGAAGRHLCREGSGMTDTMAPETEVGGTTRMNMIQAINSALDVMMARDPDVIVMGEDVGYFGGVFRATAGLQAKYGKTRVFDTPITEIGIIGVAIGMGAYGLRPVPEIQFADYIYPALDQLVSEAARLRYRSAGEFTSPITVRSPFGGGIFGGQTHSQSPEGIFTHVSGIKTVIPSTPYDAKGLLIAAIEDNDPVLFFEPKRIYNGPFNGHWDRPAENWSKHPAGEVPTGYYRVAAGQGERSCARARR